jgi:predicted nucleic acid-binding protein
MDAFIAATAERHDLVLVTRNLTGLRALGLRPINAWTLG